MSDIKCPHCGEIQADCHNGGDPGLWWSCDHIPDGEMQHDCDHCNKEFTVVISWEPSFEGVENEED